jgi:hypothetical protein
MLTNQSTLTRAGALRWLDKLEEAQPAFTAYFTPSMPGPEIEKTLLAVLDRGQLLDEIAGKVEKSPTGAIVLYFMDKTFVIWPPFPLKENKVVRSYDAGSLKMMLDHDWRLGLVLIRLGHYAIGIFQGERLIEGKAGTGLVHARHHKGGSSANRFARHREKQMEYFFTRVEIHAREIIEPHLKEIDFILYGGTRDTLQVMWRQCSFFNNLQSKTIGRLLSVREPKRASFEEAIGLAYMSTVFEIKE